MSAAGLPVSRLINVSINLSPPAAQAPNLNTCLIIGSSDVIDVDERIRTYDTLDEVAADFGTTAPEYLAAQAFFGQVPQPSQVFIGRWAQTATSGILFCGALASANQVIGPWNAVTSGSFFFFEDGIPWSVTEMDFSGDATLNAVAATIQTALAALEASTTCVYDATNKNFVITSGSTGTSSTVSFLQAPTASGYIGFSGQPSDADTVTLNGTAIEFVTGTPTGEQVQIGDTEAHTIAALAAFINANVAADTQIAKFKAVATATKCYLYAVTAGTGGDALTLAKSGTNLSVSGATLSGATGTDISHLMAGLSTDGGRTVTGIAAEEPVDAVTILDDQSTYWYMMGFADQSDLSNSQTEAVAAYIEGANNKHIYGVSTTDANVPISTSTTDIAYLLSQAAYRRTTVQYSANAYAVFSLLGRAVTVNFNGNLTTITLMYKVEPGIVAENLTSSQADAVHAKNCNVFVEYNNNTAIIEYGQMSSGDYFDDIQDLDWFANAIQTAVFNLLYTSTTKIPMTDAGNHMIANAIETACAQAVANGTLAAGYWDTNGFGQLKQGDYLPKGYYIYQPPIYLETQADRAARKSVPFQVAAKLAGAVHTVDVIVNVNR